MRIHPGESGGGGSGKSGNREKVERRWMMNGGVMVVLRAKPKYNAVRGGRRAVRKEDDRGVARGGWPGVED